MDKKELVELLKKEFWDEDLCGIDISNLEFDCNVDISGMNVDGNIIQSHNFATGVIVQNFQEARSRTRR